MVAHILTETTQVNVDGIPSVSFQGSQRVVGTARSISTRSYTPLKVLGDGTSATVWLCDWHAHWTLAPNTPLPPMQCGTAAKPEWAGKHLVAVKRIKKPWESGWDECQYIKELQSLRAIPLHPNIIPLYDFFLAPHSREIYFVFECMEGNLHRLIKSHKGLAFAGGLVSLIFRQIISGINHIHASGYFHRDLRPEHVLVTTTGLFEYTPVSPRALTDTHPETDVVVIIKITDFGVARETRSSPPYTECVTARWYRAPEVLLLSQDYSTPVDMWALGTILAELVNLRPIFPGSSPIDQIARICEILGDPSDVYGTDSQNKPLGGGKWPKGIEMAMRAGFTFPKVLPKDIYTLFDPTIPISLVQCIGDLLKYDPQSRLTSRQCLEHDYFVEVKLQVPGLPGVQGSVPRSPRPSVPRIVPPSHHQDSTLNQSYLSGALSNKNPNFNQTRYLIREAITILCNTMSAMRRSVSDVSNLKGKPRDEVEVRIRALVLLKWRWEGESSTARGVSEMTERQAFTEALRDGYVLCQLINKLRPSSLISPDAREDGFVLNSNVTNFIATCSSLGLSSTDIFLCNDLIIATGESLARVARTVLAVSEALDRPNGSPLDPLGPPGHLSDTGTGKRVNRDIEERGVEDLPIHLEQVCKVYPNLLSFLMEVVSADGECAKKSYRETLGNLVQSMASLDPISSLVQSRRYRIKFFQLNICRKISSELGISNDSRLREALRKDDAEIANLFKVILNSEADKKAVCSLQGHNAQEFLDLIQDVLDKGSTRSLDDEEFTLKAHRLLVKLSEACDVLPTSLFIKEVERLEKEAMCGGTYGDIYRASYKGVDVALKRMRVFQRDSGRHKIRRQFCREALLWQPLKHPFLLPFLGIDSQSFPSFLCMVSPWMRHGTISKHLEDYGNANVDGLLFEIAQGIAYLHSQNIVHGDLRGSNILVNDEWHACLADFGLAVFADASAATHTSHHGGSVRWMAPELQLPQSFGLDSFKRTFASDAYSFACVCIELYTGRPPFSDFPHDAAAMLTAMAGGRPQRPSDVSKRAMSDGMWELVQSCWRQNFADRPRVSEVVEIMNKMDQSFINLTFQKLSIHEDVNHTPHVATLDSPSGGGSRSPSQTPDDRSENFKRELPLQRPYPRFSDGSSTTFGSSQIPGKTAVISSTSSNPQVSRSFTMSSTQSLEVIKADIRRVLDVMGVMYHIPREVYHCIYVPTDILPEEPRTPILLPDHRKRASPMDLNHALPPIPVGEATPPQSPTSPVTDAGSESTVHETPQVDPNGNIVGGLANNDWSVHFEIHIEKGRELPLHKIQFWKTSGDEGQYQKLATQIKAKLAVITI